VKYQSLAGYTIVLLLCSCAATSVKKSWKSPEYVAGPLTNLAVVAIDDRGLLRQGFENRFVAQLRGAGIKAITTFDLVSLPEINQDKRAAAERLRSAGCQAVVALRLKDVASLYRETRPGGERYAEVVTGIETGTWYDYYTLAFTDLSPTYGSLKQEVYLETSIFDLQTAKCLWSGLSLTVATETMDRVAEMDPIVAKFLAAMRKDGMIP
jgi:hypothetical protein